MYSLIIPVYKNEESIPDLLSAISQLNKSLHGDLEVIFVVDGSPDHSFETLSRALEQRDFSSKLLSHSRNFGSFAAIRTGLAASTGLYFAAMAADLQEPPELILDFFQTLEKNQIDITIGTRMSRDDPWLKRLSSQLFWWFYRKLILKDIPPGGVDIFGCNANVRNQILRLNESNSSLIGQLFWIGFKRKLIPYRRQRRKHGKSAWSWKSKLQYLSDSVFSFTHFPIKILFFSGSIVLTISIFYSVFILYAKLTGLINVSGYSTTVLLIAFFAGFNTLGLWVIGSYVWRTFENTKGRPNAILTSETHFKKKKKD